MQKYRRLYVRLKLKITGCKCLYEDGKIVLIFSCHILFSFPSRFLLHPYFFNSIFIILFLFFFMFLSISVWCNLSYSVLSSNQFFFAHFIITYQPTRTSAFVKPQLLPLIYRCHCEIYLFIVLIIRHDMKEQGKSSHFY